MNDFIVLIIIWIVITILNQVFKKKKKPDQPGSVPETPKTESKKEEIPPFLRDLFGIPKEEGKTPAQPPITETEYLEEEEEAVERVEDIDEIDETAPLSESEPAKETILDSSEYLKPLEVSRDIYDLVKEPTPELKVLKKPEKKRKKSRIKFNQKTLKQAFIFREIVDKPRALKKLTSYNTIPRFTD